MPRFVNDDSLKARSLRGGVWLGVGGVSEQALRLMRNMILVRLLAPEAFGLMAIILAVNAALESFTQVGLKEAIIHYGDAEDDTYLNGAWWFSLGRSVVLVVVGILFSARIVDFYHVPEDLGILRLSFLGLLFNGALSVRAYIALKRMEYKKWVLISHGGGVCGIVTSIILSFVFHNVMALVIGFIVENVARCILSFVICPYLPRFQFSGQHSKALFAYARGMFGLPILYFIYAQAAIFVIGRVLSQRETGLYSLALSLAQAPATLITSVMNQILMPAFSSRQDDKEWVNETILKSTKIVVLTGIPVAFFVALYARELLAAIYGGQYVDVWAPFAILFSTTLLGAFSIPMVNVYLAVGQPQLHRYFSGIRAVLIIVLIYPALKWFGLTGAAVAGFISMAGGYVFQVMRMRRLTGISLVKYGRIFAHGMIIALIVIVVWAATYNVFSREPLNNLIYGLIGCAIVYGIICTLYAKQSKIVKSIMQKVSII